MTHRPTKATTPALAAACLALGAVLGPSMTASGDATANVISACYSNHNGLVRILAEDEQCRPDESAIEWNRAGPQGPAGPEGPAGSGLTGIELLSAASPFDSEDTKTFEADCPPSKMVLTGGARVASDVSFPQSAAAYLNWSAPLVIIGQTTPVTWVARAGEPTPSDRSWSLVVWALCVDEPGSVSAA